MVRDLNLLLIDILKFIANKISNIYMSISKVDVIQTIVSTCIVIFTFLIVTPEIILLAKNFPALTFIVCLWIIRDYIYAY
jgi:hypothetical protein